MRKLLHTLAQQADVVLLDSPPLLAVADAIALAQAVDGVLLVVVAGRTQRQTARQAVEGLRQVGANLVGVVLNAVPTRKGSYDRYREYYRDRDESARAPPSQARTGPGRQCNGCSREGTGSSNVTRQDHCFACRLDGVTAAFEERSEECSCLLWTLTNIRPTSTAVVVRP